ncbi:uncharacterized protein LOC133923517 [Phragmites australis]|uniref:uncharacterized protein LOC133923517 n=1 Tax=Phragmites australis TaxID=29695 RepID=UPI002D787216|nr:uncharacterized protein LOC133923517 [Phragmites australis]
MGEAPCVAAPRRAAPRFHLPRHGRRKVLVVQLGSGAAGTRAACGRGRRLRWWLRRAVWRLAELCCVAALPGHPGGPTAPASWAGVEPHFAAPFVPVALMKRSWVQD